MKILRPILMNPLVLATLVTVLASTILVAYSEHRLQPGGQVARITVRATDAMPSNLTTASTPGQVDAAPRKAAEGAAVIVWGIEIPVGSYIDAML